MIVLVVVLQEHGCTTSVLAYGVGSMTLTDIQLRRFIVEDVLYVLDAEVPILSMLKLQRQGL